MHCKNTGVTLTPVFLQCGNDDDGGVGDDGDVFDNDDDGGDDDDDWNRNALKNAILSEYKLIIFSSLKGINPIFTCDFQNFHQQNLKNTEEKS